MRYAVTVIETRTVQVEYVVEADDEEEARALAEIGDTVEEVESNKPYDVVDRTLTTDPKGLPEA